VTKILFVEDEPWGVNAYFQALQRNGFACVLVKDVETAVAKLQTENFDVLSLDIMFPTGKEFGDAVEPRQAGLHLLELIRAGKVQNCNPNIKVIVLTAVFNKQVEERLKKLGVIEYLKKPVTFDKVIETFKQVKG
jgi:CheY-like chemotaxis protein